MEWYHFAEIATPFVIAIVGVLVKYIIRSELKPIVEHIDDHKGRIMVIESWKDGVKADVSTISATNAVLARLEGTLNRVDATMGDVNKTMINMGQRVAHIEGAQENGRS